MRVIVCGSRYWRDEQRIKQEICALVSSYGDVTVVHGDCPTGADAAARKWAESRGATEERHPADWLKHGRAAGPLRNQEMADAGAELCDVGSQNGPPSRTVWVHGTPASIVWPRRWSGSALRAASGALLPCTGSSPGMKTQTESLASKWGFYWTNYISALRSGSETRIKQAKAELDEVRKEIG